VGIDALFKINTSARYHLAMPFFKNPHIGVSIFSKGWMSMVTGDGAAIIEGMALLLLLQPENRTIQIATGNFIVFPLINKK
jgi:hypothetical protein